VDDDSEASRSVRGEAGAESELTLPSSSSSIVPEGWNWNLLPPQSGQPDSISLEPSGNVRPQFVHW
jgi:hypothetical protein